MFESIPFIHNIVNIYNLYYMCFISAWVCFFFFFKPFFFITRTPQKTKTEQTKNQTKTNRNKTKKTEQRTQVTGYLTSFRQGSLPQSPGGRVVNNTVQRRAHEPSAMQSQLQGMGGWGILVLKKGASQQRVWFCPLQMLKEVSTCGTWEPRLPAAPVSSSPCLESLVGLVFFL